MNPVTDIVFSLTWVFLFIWAVRSMFKGWNTNMNTPSGVWTTKVTKPMHPEMIDVKPGEELMGVTFETNLKTSCDIDDYNELQTRINDLKEQLEDDDENLSGVTK